MGAGGRSPLGPNKAFRPHISPLYSGGSLIINVFLKQSRKEQKHKAVPQNIFIPQHLVAWQSSRGLINSAGGPAQLTWTYPGTVE